MELRKATKTDMDSVKGLYEGSFPIEERRPWEDLETRALDGDPFFSLRVVEDAGRVVGFITTWRLPMALYVEHFAVDASMRGRGLGGEIIDKLVASTDQPVLLEVELPENEMARRRIEFYRRHGFDTIDGVDYIQPPYTRNLPEVPMLLMSTRPIDDIETAIRILHQIVYNQ